MTSAMSFDIDSEYRIDDLCKMVLGKSEYQQASVRGELTTLQIITTININNLDGLTPGTTSTVKTTASKYGKALIHKLELLKDTRFSHWRHEFIVLTLTYASETRLLYLEHSWDGTGLGERIPVTLSSLVGSQKGSADEAMFYKPNDPHENHRRKCTMTVLEIQFSDHSTHSPVTLHSIARILRQIGTKHKAYALFSANCWAWSRGIVMAIAIESSSNVEIVTMSGRDVTLDQLKIYLLTEYGAFGGLLLHCIGVSRTSQCTILADSLNSQRKGGMTYVGTSIVLCDVFASFVASLVSDFGSDMSFSVLSTGHYASRNFAFTRTGQPTRMVKTTHTLSCHPTLQI